MAAESRITAARELDWLPRALDEVATVLRRSRQTHPNDDGFDKPAGFHIERARRHLELLATHDRGEDHLARAACRLLMALEARLR